MRDVQYTMLVDKGHFTSCFAIYVVLLLVKGTGILLALGTFTRCFMLAVRCDEAPPPPQLGGGERASADSQNRLGAKWGQVEVTYCRLG
jgi:hypothetical protein